MPEPREDPEPRSEFLRGQMKEWMTHVVETGSTTALFELEMWLRSFERFFRIRNQPLSEKEVKQLALRNWSEELRLVDHVLLRVVQLCTLIQSEEEVNQTRFGKYLDGYLKKDELVDPYVEKLLHQSNPDTSLTLLREAFEDLHVLLADLVKLSRIPYATFTAVGKALHREIRRSHLLALLIDKKFKPIHDRIQNTAIALTIKHIEDPQTRKQAARLFLEFFRLLHYLEYTDPDQVGEDGLKATILIFALITSETRLVLSHVERRVLKLFAPDHPFFQTLDAFVYCLPLELRKVIHTELLDISVSRQTDTVRAGVENSHGILKDCFQQAVVQLAQVFDPNLSGRDIFPDFTAKLEQSVQLRDGLGRVIKALQRFQSAKDEASAARMKEAISAFYDVQMKYLMYRDWSGFELFFIEILKCPSLAGLIQIGHRFETFLMTLYKEVQKRAILQDVPLAHDLPGIETTA